MINNILKRWAEKKMASRAPDFIIGPDKNPPYIRRWWIIPRNKFFNIYLHEVQQDDDDRALHDHPWWNMSYVIEGGYNEITPKHPEGKKLLEGQYRFRWASQLHRLALLTHPGRTITLFITGPRIREWGFQCPQGWRHWKIFTGESKGVVGRGCGD